MIICSFDVVCIYVVCSTLWPFLVICHLLELKINYLHISKFRLLCAWL